MIIKASTGTVWPLLQHMVVHLEHSEPLTLPRLPQVSGNSIVAPKLVRCWLVLPS